MVYVDFWKTKFIHILVTFERRFPAVRTFCIGFDYLLLKAPTSLLIHIRDVKIGFDYLIISHGLSPEYFLAKSHFPAPGQLALTLYILRGNDFIPAVLRVTEDDRTNLFQGIDAVPELALLFLLRKLGKFSYPQRQLPKDLALPGSNLNLFSLKRYTI
jgi:hypothetical protein